MTEADEAKKRREALNRRYGEAFKRASEILFEEDLVGINFEENTDEYEPEVGTILPRLHDCQSVADVNRVMHDEFVKWFDAGIAGSPEKYQSIAKRFWDEIIPLLKGNSEPSVPIIVRHLPTFNLM